MKPCRHRPIAARGRLEHREGLGEGGGCGVDRQVRAIDPPELARVGVDVDERLVGVGALQKCVVGRRHFAHAAADKQDQIGFLDVGAQLRIDADADVAGIARVKLIAQRLPAERAADGKLPAVERRAETRDGGLAPARAAEDHERPLRGRKQLGQVIHLRSPGPRLDGHEGARLRRVHAVYQHVLG